METTVNKKVVAEQRHLGEGGDPVMLCCELADFQLTPGLSSGGSFYPKSKSMVPYFYGIGHCKLLKTKSNLK